MFFEITPTVWNCLPNKKGKKWTNKMSIFEVFSKNFIFCPYLSISWNFLKKHYCFLKSPRIWRFFPKKRQKIDEKWRNMRKYSKNGHLFFCVFLRKNLHIGGDLKKNSVFSGNGKNSKKWTFYLSIFCLFLAQKIHIGGDLKK